MNNQRKIKQIRALAIVVCVLLTLGLGAMAVQRYYISEEAIKILEQHQVQLSKLSNEIEQTKNFIDLYKQEQKEFRELLFEERDVPSFLDRISDSATKSLVYVLEMKTQKFTEVQIPKKAVESAKLGRARVYEDFENNKPPDPQIQLTEMLTLAAMPINIKIQGNFESIVNFLNSIEGYRQLLTVSNVEISAGNNYPKLTCDFTLRIYSLKNLNDIKP